MIPMSTMNSSFLLQSLPVDSCAYLTGQVTIPAHGSFILNTFTMYLYNLIFKLTSLRIICICLPLVSTKFQQYPLYLSFALEVYMT